MDKAILERAVAEWKRAIESEPTMKFYTWCRQNHFAYGYAKAMAFHCALQYHVGHVRVISIERSVPHIVNGERRKRLLKKYSIKR